MATPTILKELPLWKKRWPKGRVSFPDRLLGEGEIPADWALLIRSILGQRSPKTQIITNARSS